MAHSMPNKAAIWQPAAADAQEARILEVAESALARARAAGASMAEARVGHEQGISVTVRNGEVETVERHRDKGLDVTVYFGHRRGSASTTDFGADAIAGSVSAACNIARHTEEDDCNGLAEAELLARDFPDLDLCHPWDIELEQAIEIAAACEGAARGYDKRISNSEGASVSSHIGADLYANSHGFRGLERGSRHGIDCAVIAGRGDAMQRDFWFDSARDARDLCAPGAIGEEAARRTVRRLHARKARTTECAVIFEPPVAASLLSHLVAAVSGHNLYRKASFLLDKAGARIFPQSVRIHEQPHLRKSAGGASFDGEGVSTGARDLVCGGVLRGYVLNCYAARKLGARTTGNAGGVRNLEITPTTDARLADLIAQMGDGVVVSELIGYGVNTVTGDYSRGAFGFLVKNGEIQHPLQEFTIAGNLSDIFRDITAVGADTDRRRNLRAGAIAVGKMAVAGQ
ncbi:MAG: metalloprotease PmbA [Gammaproteobacteria bacterium]